MIHGHMHMMSMKIDQLFPISMRSGVECVKEKSELDDVLVENEFSRLIFHFIKFVKIVPNEDGFLK